MHEHIECVFQQNNTTFYFELQWFSVHKRRTEKNCVKLFLFPFKYTFTFHSIPLIYSKIHSKRKWTDQCFQNNWTYWINAYFNCRPQFTQTKSIFWRWKTLKTQTHVNRAIQNSSICGWINHLLFDHFYSSKNWILS